MLMLITKESCMERKIDDAIGGGPISRVLSVKLNPINK